MFRYLPRNVMARLHCKHVFCLCAKLLQSCVTLWKVARQAPLSMGFSRQEYWSGLPLPSPEDLPNPGIKSKSLRFSALADGLFTASTISFIGNCHTLFQSICIILYAQHQCRSDPVSSLSSPAFGVVTTFYLSF